MRKRIAYPVFTGIALALILSSSCQNAINSSPDNPSKIDSTNGSRINEDSLLTNIQQHTFQYFWEGAEPTSGLARERIHMDGVYPQNDRNVVTIGGSGFGLMGMIVAMEREFISKEQGVQKLDHIMDYLGKIERFKGAWAHWYDGELGTAKPFSEKDNGGDIVETAFLAQGLIAIREYLKDKGDPAQKVAQKADNLWKEINWNHYTNGQNVIYWHWSPKFNFQQNHPVRGYDECLITYILAASSPTYPIAPSVYHEGWARSGAIKTAAKKYDIPLVLKHNAKDGEVGPLFWEHYSYLGLSPKGLKDQYADYWEATSNHAKINLAYADLNPKGYTGYGSTKGWGWTASYSINGYDAHHPDNDPGVIAPTAALSSMPYTPHESMQFAQYLDKQLRDKIWGKYGYYDAYSETANWYPQRYLAIDQGPIIVMIENYRTGKIWDLFMQAPEIQQGLKKLGFTSPYLK